jgi:8-oxo-dGTP pyrophosphatase MutT (NUDIX family)
MIGTVQVVLINPGGYVLGVSRKNDHNDFGLPGGSLEDFDNSPEEGAIRETFEETGLKIDNLRLVYAKSKGGRMGYTYLADYSGEINFDFEKEPHVVKFTTFDELIKGSFGKWNKEVYQSLINLNIFVKLTESECGTCVNCKCKS